MSDGEDLTIERRGDSPLRREVGAEGRAGCRHHAPSDPEATPSDDDDVIVGRGERVRDAVTDEAGDDYTRPRYRDLHSPHPSPVTRRQQSTVGKMAAPRLRSVVTKPVELRLTGGRDRATSGAGVLRLCRPGREGESSTIA